MNTKKNKNKQKQHKPPTPQPKQEVSDIVTENLEQPEVQVKTELVKCEERVPEIVSENFQPSLESKQSEGDAPKKPKRNRGKKKKTDKGDEVECTLDEPVLEENKNVSESKEIQDMTEVKPSATPELTPVARKKKNKNKKNLEQSEKPAEQEVKVSSIKKDEELTDLKIITVVPVATEQFEDSKSKKKNKKKKRIDSERSEKSEEVLSCTTAFQKLLESKDDKKDVKKDTKQENILEETTILKDVDQGPSTKPIADIGKDTLVPDLTKRDKSTEYRNESREESGKGKKKNKKDRKQPPKEESEDEVLKPLQTKTEVDSEGQTVTVPAETEIHAENVTQKDMNIGQLHIEKPSEVTLLHKEKSPKAKAKIAKPVEKKRKEKQDVSSTENLYENVLENVLSEDKPKAIESISIANIVPEEKLILVMSTEKSDVKEQQQVIQIDVDVSSSKPEQDKQETRIIDAITTEVQPDNSMTIQPIEVAHETAKMELPESGTGKKRKKSPKPKPSKTTETTHQSLAKSENIEGSNIQQETSMIKEAKQECEFQEPKINEPTTSSFELLAPQDFTKTVILERPEISKEQNISKETVETAKKEIPTEKQIEKEIIQVSEANIGKKRKKSPKPQRKSGKSDTSSADTSSVPKQEPEQKNVSGAEQTIASVETLQDKPQGLQMTDSLADLPVLEDIEIRSVKADESEGSVCDITPDIHYPRASSQLLDDNNNTVIREVTAADVKLSIPILPETPLVHGSVQTPLPPPDRTHPGVTITEVITAPQEEKPSSFKSSEQEFSTFKQDEKTDLKSKVLDVNQGMEELRRSIERSLAELSSMEKSEKEAEDQFFKAQAKLEHITQMASKKNEDKKKEIKTEHVKESQSKVTETQKTQMEENNTKKDNKQPDVKLAEVLMTVSRPEENNTKLTPIQPPPVATSMDINIQEPKLPENVTSSETHGVQTPPVPARKDNKGKGKKKKGKQELESSSTSTIGQSSNISTTTSATTSNTKEQAEETKKDEKSEQKTDKAQEKGKQQSASLEDDKSSNDVMNNSLTDSVKMDFEPIENFEDALYASVDENEQDVNKTFEIIANEATKCDESQNPEINITAPLEDEEKANDKKDHEKVNPLSQPKNLLGHPDIPARLNKTDYKKEKNKQTPNTKQATVKIKDAVPIEVTKESKESQTENKRRFLKDKTVTESITSITSENEEYIYKYSFRKVFLPSACHVCKKELKAIRVPCNFCNLIFYCSLKHKDEDYSQHQGLCFAVSTIVHLRDKKHIYADAKNITGHEYRLLRMQMIVSCEKVLKRRLVPWEQEALLYPRMCADAACREWRYNKLTDCEGCGQISYCSDDPTHLPKSHQRWCKSYSLYNKLVVYQQTKGRLEPKLPTKVMAELYQIPEKLNEVLASMYEEKIDMTDIQYAALTQIATAPLTAAYCHQIYNNKMNTIYANGVLKKSSFTIHVVGAELQFEADALNKWEVFFLHLRPDVKDLRVVLIGPDLNPSKLPLDLLSKIKLCENCRQNKRRVVFDFQDKKTYYEYWSTDFSTPDLVCAFNPSIQRSSVFNGKDTWPSTVKCILKLKVPFIVTSYTMSELQNDLCRIKECAEVDVNTISEAEFNAFASVRPDRNFISDDEMPLLFKNYCFATVCGAF